MWNSLLWVIMSLLMVALLPAMEKIRIPAPAILILVGMAFGPVGLELIKFDQFEKLLTEIIVVFILFSAGFEIRWRYFIKAIRPGLIVGLVGISMSLLLGAVATFSITQRPEEALYVGVALAATSIGFSVPLLSKAKILNTKLGQILLAAAVIDDILALYLLSALHIGLSSQGSGISSFFFSLSKGSVSLAVLCITIHLLWKGLSKQTLLREHRIIRLTFIVSLIAGTSWITHELGMSAAIGGFLCGAILAYTKTSCKQPDVVIFDRLSGYLAPAFFLSIGMQITQLSNVNWHSASLLALVLTAAFIGKLMSPWILKNFISRREKWIMGVALLPRGEVGLIVASIGFQQGHLQHSTLLVLIIMVLVTSLTASIAIPWLVQNYKGPLRQDSIGEPGSSDAIVVAETKGKYK